MIGHRVILPFALIVIWCTSFLHGWSLLLYTVTVCSLHNASFVMMFPNVKSYWTCCLFDLYQFFAWKKIHVFLIETTCLWSLASAFSAMYTLLNFSFPVTINTKDFPISLCVCMVPDRPDPENKTSSQMSSQVTPDCYVFRIMWRGFIFRWFQ